MLQPRRCIRSTSLIPPLPACHLHYTTRIAKWDIALAETRALGYTEISEYLHYQKYRKEKPVDETVRVRQRGTLTLPASLREKYGIEPGDTFRLVDLDGVFVLTPMVPMVPELAREIERARLEAGLDTRELLAGLREQREQYFRERYGDAETS